MEKLRLLCRILYVIGGLVLLFVLFAEEWATLKDDWSIIINPLVHLGVFLGLFFKPVFWVGLALMLLGHVGDMSLGTKEE